jgi:outer membrane protein assembly factor BamD (BamD/ComL family)
LLLLVQAYDKLGMTDLRNDAERVMKTNFRTVNISPAKWTERAVVADLEPQLSSSPLTQ